MASAPKIEKVAPAAAIPGGEIAVYGSGFTHKNGVRPNVRFGTNEAGLMLCTENRLVVRVPDGALGEIRVSTPDGESKKFPFAVGLSVADNLHPVANPAVDREGNVYVTFSGQRGQKVPVSLYKITPNFVVKPFATEMVNPTGLALDHEGTLYVSCRNDGTIHRITPDGRAQRWVEGMGIATGLAFDKAGALYCGDRSGTIFKIYPDRQILVFATLEPSVAAYHLVFNAAGDLLVTGPTTSSYDRIVRISPGGDVSSYFRGLGRPQGMAMDAKGNLYVAASHGGRRGVVRITPQGKAEVVLSGSGLVGLALLPSRRAYLATGSILYSIDWDVEGVPLPP
ncbi:MAG TPA: gluconolaconase [Candidatus Binatia bacterium]|nr:gluconolaconase [Candidatus Binatia bacterium]